MGTVSAIAFTVFLVATGWWLYLRSGARAWTAERDPLGEPPVRMAALIAAIIVGVAVFSSGGGGAEHTGAMQQGLDDSNDDDGLFSTETSEASAGERTEAASTGDGAKSASRTNRTASDSTRSRTTSASTSNRAASASSTDPNSASTEAPPTGQPKRKATQAPAAESTPALPSYGKLVVRARKAARARGAEIRWYPTLAAEAREATERRTR
ncbi:MAG: hypothetical protein Q7T55_08270 [Solirubrobacteraceae bacterium]|nr:hypothetical protein [Solirubrobacteraceae bacterium]